MPLCFGITSDLNLLRNLKRHVSTSLTGWTKLAHSFNFLKELEMEICKDRDTCKRAEWWVLKIWCVFLFLQTHNFKYICLLFAFLKICLNEWIVFKRLYYLFVWKCWCFAEGFVVPSTLQNICSKTPPAVFKHSLYDERAEQRLWHSRHLPLWKSPELLCRSVCISFWLLLKIYNQEVNK